MAVIPRRYTRRSQEEWQSLMIQWQQSDLSVTKFCKHHTIGAASFYKWRQRRAVYEQAKQQRPERWSQDIKDMTPVGAVSLNPERDEVKIKMAA